MKGENKRREKRVREWWWQSEKVRFRGELATLIMYHTIQIFITVCPKARLTDGECVCVVYMCFYVLLFFHVSVAVIVKSSARHGDEKGCAYEAYAVAHLSSTSWCACCFLIIIIIIAAAVHHCEPVFFSTSFYFFFLWCTASRREGKKKRATTACGDTYGRRHA